MNGLSWRRKVPITLVALIKWLTISSGIVRNAIGWWIGALEDVFVQACVWVRH
jgi:hypothetical protein